MKLCLENIGRIRSACVEINGITVIAGENNTGKSTVGKALFAVFNSLYRSEEKIATERQNSIRNQLLMLYRNTSSDLFFEIGDNELTKKIISGVKKLKAQSNTPVAHDAIKDLISNIIRNFDDRLTAEISEEDIATCAEGIAVIFSVADEVIFQTVLQRRLDAEFNSCVSNLYADCPDGQITLGIRNDEINIMVSNDKVTSTDKRISLGTEAIYIDDPFILDEVPAPRYMPLGRYPDHRIHLKNKLGFTQKEANVVEEIVANSKLDYIYQKVSSVCDGDVVRGKRSALSYKVSDSEKMLDIRSLSTGLKTFVILKMLLVNGRIEANGTIILDEPEVHLHPEWQLLFAEIIVLLHREFGLHILLNTHSPYFLNAVEVYAAKYDVDNKCKYYLAYNSGNTSYLEDVTNNIEAIYTKLARPLQDLENERYYHD